MRISAKDAATKICPFRAGKPCCADACMGWRWAEDQHELIRTQVTRQPEGDGWTPYVIRDGVQYWRRDRKDARDGYCGAVVGELRINVDSYVYSNSTEGVPITPEFKNAQKRNLKVSGKDWKQGWEEVRAVKA